MTRFCSFCQKNQHTVLYCRTEAHNDDIKRQQTRDDQERRTVFTHDYNKKEDRILRLRTLRFLISRPNMGTKIIRNLITKMVVTQIEIETEIQTQVDSINQIDQAFLGPTDQTPATNSV